MKLSPPNPALRRVGVRHVWAPIAATLLVGVSLGLPLFLYLRDVQIEEPQTPIRA